MEENEYPGTWRICALRILKSMQAQVLRDRETIWSLRHHAPDGTGRARGAAHPDGPEKWGDDLDDQIADALKTASDHIQALEHVIQLLGRPEG